LDGVVGRPSPTSVNSLRRPSFSLQEGQSMTTKYVYYFGDGQADGSADMRNLLGGKGANLHEMNRLGLPVPVGFTLSTDVSTYCDDHGRLHPPERKAHFEEALLKA